jgi:hypothetical protein
VHARPQAQDNECPCRRPAGGIAALVNMLKDAVEQLQPVTAGCFVNGHCLSVMMRVDLTTEAGVTAWRNHAVDFVLAAARATGREL